MADQANPLRRVFVAGVAGGARPSQAEAPAPSVDDDLPVLTDVVAVATASAPAALDAVAPVEPAAAPLPPDRVEALARELLFARLPMQRQALADELAAWLDDQLPQAVLRVLDGVTDRIIAQVTEEARDSLLPRLQVALEDEESQPPRDAD